MQFLLSSPSRELLNPHYTQKASAGNHAPFPWAWPHFWRAGCSKAYLSEFAGMVGSMDTMQLSAVKREIVVFLKSMFERGLFDLVMLAEILCCCIWCVGNSSPAALLAWPGTVLDPLYLGSERVKAQDGGSLDISSISITREVSRKMLSVIILDLRADFAPC